DEEDEEVEEDFNLVSTTSAFTNAELLFGIHNFVVDKLKHDDNHFFEGLTLWEGENPSSLNAPLYFLMQGN
ncbi:sugar transporter, partial [Prevotella corporis]|nr:sugar transporter [Prevotella corporis]